MGLALLGFIDADSSTSAVFRRVAGDIRLRHNVGRDMVFLINQRNPRAGANTVQTAFPHKVVIVHRADDTT